MGNHQTRAVTGVGQVTGGLVAENMLEATKTAILNQNVFKTIFKNNVFVNDVPAYNETILPAWEFRFSTEKIMGGDLRHEGVVNSRVLFPNKLVGAYDIHRKVALAIGRFFNNPRKDIFDNVKGLTHIGEDLEFTYDQVFAHGGMQVPAILIKIPFMIDLRRYRIECPEVPLDEAELDADLVEEWEQRIQIHGLDTIDDEKSDDNILIEESVLSNGD